MPASEQPNFVNGVAGVRCDLSPHALLEACQAIENRLGRVRPAAANAARTLDIDIIDWDGVRLSDGLLEIPHPRLAERLFVLGPLRDIAPDWRHPVTGIAIAVLAGAMEPVTLAPIAWPMIALGLGTGLVRNWHRYQITGCHRVIDMIRGEIARASLTYIVLVSGVAGLSNKPHAWRRTPKFGASGGIVSALACTIPEMVLAVVTLAIAGFMAASAGTLGVGFALLVAMIYGFLGLRFLCAPYMALLALRKPQAEAEGAGRQLTA